VTVNSVVDDTVAALEEVVGGRWGRVCLAPNDAIQYGGIVRFLATYVQHDALIQECLAGVRCDAVVRITALSERGSAAATRNFPDREPPHGTRKFYH
ncbi:hypothetical protein PHYSODRAFT_510629, partial [Phytophthora sojae]